MKRYIIHNLCLVTILLAGCTDERNVDTNKETQNLLFNITLNEASTSATRTVSDMEFATHGFHIAGYHTVGQFSDSEASPTPNIFDKEPGLGAVPLVTKNAADRYELPIAKLILQDGTFLSFFAWAQNKTQDATSGVIASTNSTSQTGAPFLDIRVNNAPALQTDIVGSRFMNHHNDYVLSAVDLKFSHLLSKLTFKVRSSTGCKIEFTDANILYTANKVYQRAKFTFAATAVPATSDVDSLLGTYSDFSEFHSGKAALTTSYTTITGNNIVSLGDMTLIPQNTADGFCSLELTYNLTTQDDIVEKTITKEVPLKAIDLLRGKNYIYTLDITADKIELSPGLIAEWADDVSQSGLPLIAGPKGNVLLLLEGSDPPYTHTDGTQYWLDRSGYNRHCKIEGGNLVKHDPKIKGYTLSNPATGFTVPSLGKVSALTLDMICTATGTGDQKAFFFSDNGTNRKFFTHFAYRGTKSIYFDCGDTGGNNFNRMRAILNSQKLATTTGMYTFCYALNSNVQTVMRNGETLFERDVRDKWNGFGNVELKSNTLGNSFAGTFKRIKITSDIVPLTETKKEFELLKKKYQMTPTNELYEQSYVGKGLILNLDGKFPTDKDNVTPHQLDPKTWNDLSGNQKHAEISLNANDPWLSGFYFNDEWAKLPSLGQMKNYTIEFVVTGSKNTVDCTLLYFGTDQVGGINGGRAFGVYYPWYGESCIHFDSPYSSTSSNRNKIDLKNFKVGESDQWSVTRQQYGDFIVYNRNSKPQFTSPKFPATIQASFPLPLMTHCYIGADRITYPINANYQFSGTFHCLRVYDRVLTEEERTHNYELDKIKYNIK